MRNSSTGRSEERNSACQEENLLPPEELCSPRLPCQAGLTLGPVKLTARAHTVHAAGAKGAGWPAMGRDERERTAPCYPSQKSS